MLNHF